MTDLWFLGEEKVGPSLFYIVWTNRDSSGAGALLFHEPFLTTPLNASAADEADRRARACLSWVEENQARGTEVLDWINPPHKFTLFLSVNPGAAVSFVCDGVPPSTIVLELVKRTTAELGLAWPEWRARLAAGHEVAEA